MNEQFYIFDIVVNEYWAENGFSKNKEGAKKYSTEIMTEEEKLAQVNGCKRIPA